MDPPEDNSKVVRPSTTALIIEDSTPVACTSSIDPLKPTCRDLNSNRVPVCLSTSTVIPPTQKYEVIIRDDIQDDDIR